MSPLSFGYDPQDAPDVDDEARHDWLTQRDDLHDSERDVFPESDDDYPPESPCPQFATSDEHEGHIWQGDVSQYWCPGTDDPGPDLDPLYCQTCGQPLDLADAVVDTADPTLIDENRGVYGASLLTPELVERAGNVIADVIRDTP